MHALILAAGRGSRMGDLTLTTPKPLLAVDRFSLLEHQILRLGRAGVLDITINTAWLGDSIERVCGDGGQYGVRIQYSHERDGALETAGGIANALNLISTDPFLAVNADVWIEREYPELTLMQALGATPRNDAHIVLASNPSWHADGDFYLAPHGVVFDDASDQASVADDLSLRRLTFTGIAAYRKRLFHNLPEARYPLGPLLRQAMHQNRVSGEHISGRWISVDTAGRLQTVRRWQAERDQTVAMTDPVGHPPD